MRKLFITAVLAATTLMACSLYLSDDPTQPAPDDQPSTSSDVDRGHGRPHRDAGPDGDANPGGNDSGVPDDGACCADPDGGQFPDGGPRLDGGQFPDGGQILDGGQRPDGGRY